MIAHVSTAASFDLTYSHVLLNVRGKIWRKKKKTSAGDFIIEWTSPNIATQIKKPTIFLGCIVLWDHCQWLAQTSLYNAPLYSRKKEMIFLNEIRDCVNVEVGNWQTARRIWRSGGQNNEEKKTVQAGRRLSEQGDEMGTPREAEESYSDTVLRYLSSLLSAWLPESTTAEGQVMETFRKVAWQLCYWKGGVDFFHIPTFLTYFFIYWRNAMGPVKCFYYCLFLLWYTLLWYTWIIINTLLLI